MKISLSRLLRLLCGVLVLSLTFGCGADNASFTERVLVSIEVLPANPTMAIGTDLQFTATGHYSDSSSQDLTVSVFWNSSSTAVATISNAANSNGLATAVATGTTTISATLSGISGNTPLTVLNVTLVSIEVTPANPSVTAGNTLQFTATGHYLGGTTQDLTQTTNLTWSSSNPSIATIANTPRPQKGLATGVSAGGPVTIQALFSSISGTTSLTVTP
jgi:uncharacterized protein YjdB